MPRVQVSPTILPLLRSGSRGPTSLPTELAMHSPSELHLLAVLPEPTAVAPALAVKPPTAAGDSSQPVPWSCQPVSKYVDRILVSTIPEAPVPT